MRLFLCGGGSGQQIKGALDEFSKIIDKTKPILYVPLAMEQEKLDGCYRWFKDEIKILNISNFEMVRSSYELSRKKFSEYSAIFIGGGNTYRLLKELRENDNIEKIKEYLRGNGIVFGGSAGAIIFGKNIDSCFLDDKNDVNLTYTEGFNYLNGYSLLCHLSEEKLSKNMKYLEKYSTTNKVLYLPEEDVIFIDNKNYSIFGNSDYVLFKDGRYRFKSASNLKKDINN